MCMSFGTKTSDVNCQIAFSVIRMGLSLGRATRILGSGAKAKLQDQFSFVLLFQMTKQNKKLRMQHWRFRILESKLFDGTENIYVLSRDSSVGRASD